MSATILGNQFTAWTFDTFRSYRPAWQVYTALLVCALIPVLRLRRRAASDVATVRPTGTRVTEVSPYDTRGLRGRGGGCKHRSTTHEGDSHARRRRRSHPQAARRS